MTIQKDYLSYPLKRPLEVLQTDWTMLTILSFDPILVPLQMGL